MIGIWFEKVKKNKILFRAAALAVLCASLALGSGLECENEGSYTQGAATINVCGSNLYSNGIVNNKNFSGGKALRIFFGDWQYNGIFSDFNIELVMSRYGGKADIYLDGKKIRTINTKTNDSSLTNRSQSFAIASALDPNTAHDVKVEFSEDNFFDPDFECGQTAVLLDSFDIGASGSGEAQQSQSFDLATENSEDCSKDGTCAIAVGEDFISEISFETLPIDTAQPPNSDSAVLQGEITDMGSIPEAYYWFRYYPCNNPSLAQETTRQIISTPEEIEAAIKNLFADTLYCYNLILQDTNNPGNILSGDTQQFKTESPSNGLQCPQHLFPEDKMTLDSLSQELKWSITPGANFYQIAVYQDGWAGQLVKSGGNASTNLLLNDGLQWGHDYYWGVRACKEENADCAQWCLPWSFSVGKKISRPIISNPSGTSYDSSPIIKWEAVTGAVVYEYILQTADGKIIESNILTENKFFPKDDLGLGEYIFKVKACADMSGENCSEYSTINFRLVEPQELAGDCALLTIGTQKNYGGKSYLDKCVPSSYCASGKHYAVEFNEPIDIFKEFPVMPESGNYPDIYLLDPKNGKKYYPGEIGNPVPYSKPLELVLASINITTDYSGGLMQENFSSGHSLSAELFSDARSAYDQNTKIPTIELSETRQNKLVGSVDFSFNVGLAADDPFAKMQKGDIAANEYFRVAKKSGKMYVLPEIETNLPGDAQLNVRIPKLFTYQTIDNRYFNTGCLPEVSKNLEFEIKKEQDADCDISRDCIDGVCTVSDEKCDIEFLECPEDISITENKINPQAMSLQMENGTRPESSVSCEIVYCDSEGNCGNQDMVFNEDDLDKTIPMVSDFTVGEINYCQEPVNIFLNWKDNVSDQKRFLLEISEDRNFENIIIAIDRPGSQKSFALKIPNYDSSQGYTLDYNGGQRILYARVKIWNAKGKDSGDSSPIAVFKLPPKQLAPVYFTWTLKSTTTNEYEFSPWYELNGDAYDVPEEYQWYFGEGKDYKTDIPVLSSDKKGRIKRPMPGGIEEFVKLITIGPLKDFVCATSAYIGSESYIIWEENTPRY